MKTVFIFYTQYGVRSVNETPRGAYDAARQYIDKQNGDARNRNPGGEPADEFSGEFLLLDGFQDMTAEQVADKLYYTEQPVVPLYLVHHTDKIMNREEIAGGISFARVQE